MATTCLLKLCCDCCCSCCCPWLNCCGLSVSRISYLKLIELLLSMLCESLLIKYGLPEMENIGHAFVGSLTTTIYTFTTILILLICYFLSENSYHLIRQSLFELIFNGFACGMYFSSSTYMSFVCAVWLHPQFLVKRGFWVYPAMTAVYYIGYAASVAHGVDAFLAFKYIRGIR